MNNIVFKELEENETFDPLIICSDTPFTQASFYGDWQKKLGKKVRRFLGSSSGYPVAYFQVIEYPLIAKKKYLYIPYGPVLKNSSEELIDSIKTFLSKFALENNAVFVRLDFTPMVSSEILSKYFKKASPYTYHSAYFQPRLEWFLGLDKTEEELYEGMNEKNRYSIRLSERKESKTEIVTSNFTEYLGDFIELMNGTAERNGFSLHPQAYYENIFNGLANLKGSYLTVTRYQEKVLAINMYIVYGKVVTYVFGSSSNEERNRAPAYSAQWKAICYAKQIDCKYYNFGGVSDGTPMYKSWEGLTTFKKRFGGQEIKHSDFYDIVVDSFWYRLYNLRKLIKSIKK